MLTVLFYGTLWGMLEAVMGGMMHKVHFSLTGSVMMGLGMYILANCAVKGKRNVFSCAGVGVIAASLKLLSAPFYQVGVFSRGVGHPVVSILAQSLVAVVIFYFGFRMIEAGRLKGVKYSAAFVFMGVIAGFLARTLHTVIYYSPVPLEYCASNFNAVPTVLLCGLGAFVASIPGLSIEIKKQNYLLYGSVLNLLIAVVYYTF